MNAKIKFWFQGLDYEFDTDSRMVSGGRFATITGICRGTGDEMGWPGQPGVFYKINTMHGQIGGGEDSTWRKGFSLEEKQEHVRLALEYQDSLTKAGKPKKINKKKA